MTHIQAVTTLASERYLLDEMTEPERELFEAHLFDCATCGDDVRMGGMMCDGIRAGLLPAAESSTSRGARIAEFPPAVKRSASRGWSRSVALPWAVAAMMTVAVGYQAVDRPSSSGRLSSEPAEALSPVTLRPASRGASATVSLGRTHAALVLPVDAGGASQLEFELRDAEGRTIVSGRSPAPASGAPLFLVVPTFALKAEQRYSLSVRDAAQSGGSLAEFPFTTTP
jgi:anti-sigma factor RsiW